MKEFNDSNADCSQNGISVFLDPVNTDEDVYISSSCVFLSGLASTGKIKAQYRLIVYGPLEAGSTIDIGGDLECQTLRAKSINIGGTLKANEEASYKAAPVKPIVSFEDFEKLDIRVGFVKSCEKVKKSKKLLKFCLDDGSGKDRTILSGIAQWYEPEQLVGKRVLFIANLAPRQMMGEESQGMILSAVNYNGDLSVTTTLEEVKGGSQVG